MIIKQTAGFVCLMAGISVLVAESLLVPRGVIKKKSWLEKPFELLFEFMQVVHDWATGQRPLDYWGLVTYPIATIVALAILGAMSVILIPVFAICFGLSKLEASANRNDQMTMKNLTA